MYHVFTYQQTVQYTKQDKAKTFETSKKWALFLQFTWTSLWKIRWHSSFEPEFQTKTTHKLIIKDIKVQHNHKQNGLNQGPSTKCNLIKMTDREKISHYYHNLYVKMLGSPVASFRSKPIKWLRDNSNSTFASHNRNLKGLINGFVPSSLFHLEEWAIDTNSIAVTAVFDASTNL